MEVNHVHVAILNVVNISFNSIRENKILAKNFWIYSNPPEKIALVWLFWL